MRTSPNAGDWTYPLKPWWWKMPNGIICSRRKKFKKRGIASELMNTLRSSGIDDQIMSPSTRPRDDGESLAGAVCAVSPLVGGECEFRRPGFSQVLEIPGEGDGFEIGNAPSPEKSTTWRCCAKTVIFCPLPQGERRGPSPPQPRNCCVTWAVSLRPSGSRAVLRWQRVSPHCEVRVRKGGWPDWMVPITTSATSSAVW